MGKKKTIIPNLLNGPEFKWVEDNALQIQGQDVSSPWREIPVSFKEFIESPNYCYHPSLSDAMYYECERLLGKDTTEIFSMQRVARELLILAGKGSGKSLMAVLVQEYLMYCVCCLNDPLGYFKLSSISYLDFVNVARSWEQGIRTYFSRLINITKNNMWFKANFDMTEGIKRISSPQGKKLGTINILSDKIEINPYHLRAMNYHSQAEKFEGNTILFFCMDEVSGHISDKEQQQADKTFKSLRSSTRILPYTGMLSSYPRLDETTDFLCKLMKKEVDNKRVLGARYATFELYPKKFYCGKTFKFIVNSKTGETRDIPIEHEKDFVVPEEGKAKILAMPVVIGERYIDFYFDETSKIVRKPTITTEESLTFSNEANGYYISKKLLKVDIKYPILMALDQGKVGSSCVLGVAHAENKKLIIDGIIQWNPTPKDGSDVRRIVDLQNVMDIVLKFRDYTNISKIRFDAWNTEVLRKNLESSGVNVETDGADSSSYANMRRVLQSGMIEFTDQEETLELVGQIKLLTPRGDTRKPEPMAGKQDLADVLAILCDIFVEETDIKEEDWIVGVTLNRGGSGSQMEDLVNSRQLENLVGLTSYIERGLNNPQKKKSSREDDNNFPTGVLI